MSRALLTGVILSVTAHAAILLPWMINPRIFSISSSELAPLLVTLSDSLPHDTTRPLIKSPSKQPVIHYPAVLQSTPTPSVAPPVVLLDTSPVLPDHRIQSKVLGQIQTDFSRHFYYPLLARRNGWQGHVLLGFAVESNGNITNVYIAQGSGYEILDESALSALQNVQQLPEAVAWLQGNRIEMKMPVEYRLTGG